jgi:hypothetical protein
VHRDVRGIAMVSDWRTLAAPIIARVLAETKGRPEAEVRAALRAAYPFGPREHHPYKIWLDEIRVQTGRRRIDSRARRLQGRTPLPPDARQQMLLPEEES